MLSEGATNLMCPIARAGCRGAVDDPVVPNLLVKSLNACKSFPASELGAVKKWLLILAEELSDPPPGRNLSLYWGPSYHKLRADGLLVPHLAISLQRERLEEWSPSARTEL